MWEVEIRIKFCDSIVAGFHESFVNVSWPWIFEEVNVKGRRNIVDDFERRFNKWGKAQGDYDEISKLFVLENLRSAAVVFLVDRLRWQHRITSTVK